MSRAHSSREATTWLATPCARRARAAQSTCAREMHEETGHAACPDGFDDWHLTHRYSICPQRRHRRAPGVTRDVEHVFALMVPAPFEPRLAEREHRAFRWLPWRDAADACSSFRRTWRTLESYASAHHRGRAASQRPELEVLLTFTSQPAPPRRGTRSKLPR